MTLCVRKTDKFVWQVKCLCIPSGISGVNWRTQNLVSGSMASRSVGLLYEQLRKNGDRLSGQHEFISPLQWQRLHSLPKTCAEIPITSYTQAWLTTYFQNWVDTGKSAFWLQKHILKHDGVSGALMAEPHVGDDTHQNVHACVFFPDVFSGGYAAKTNVSETFHSFCSPFWGEEFLKVLKACMA